MVSKVGLDNVSFPKKAYEKVNIVTLPPHPLEN